MHLIHFLEMLLSNIRKEFSCWFASGSRGWCWNSERFLTDHFTSLFHYLLHMSTSVLWGVCGLRPSSCNWLPLYGQIPFICFYFKTSGENFCLEIFYNDFSDISINKIFHKWTSHNDVRVLMNWDRAYMSDIKHLFPANLCRIIAFFIGKEIKGKKKSINL
jgi:hypothetical protein